MVTEVRIGIPLGDDLRWCYAQRSPLLLIQEIPMSLLLVIFVCR